MKIIKYLCLFLLLNSCSSKYKVIEDFIVENEKHDSLNKNVLIREKNNLSKTLSAYMRVGLGKKNSKEKLKIVKEINNKYSKEKKGFWNKNDFDIVDFDIIDLDSVDSYINNRKKTLLNKYYFNKISLFTISNPYFYNKNAFFYITKFQKRNYEYEDVIIMKKIKGKWVVIERIPNYFPDL